MVLEIVQAVVLWMVLIILNLCFIRILDGNKLDFGEMVHKEFLILIFICILAPVAFLMLLSGVTAKIGISIANKISLDNGQSLRRDCSRCGNRCNNECLFFKLTVKPNTMLCKGKFYDELQV